MAWPDHTPLGEVVSAEAFVDDIITICNTRLALGGLGDIAAHLYKLIRAHATLDSVNHDHGKLRDYVNMDGTAVVVAPSSLDVAWVQVQNAYNSITPATPTLAQLTAALAGIDHGGGGVG